MNYEERYKEALERAEMILCNLPEGSKSIQDIETIFPELAESEYEKIRKWLTNLFSNRNEKFVQELDNYRGLVTREQILDYLEKQKYPNEDYLNNPAFIDGFDTGREVQKIFDEQKPVEWKPQPESLEALMYAIEGKWDMIPPTSYLSRMLEDLYDGLVNTYHVDEKLLAELPKAASDEDIAALRELKRKIDDSMDKKPVEWSDTNELVFNDICKHLENEGYSGWIVLLNALRNGEFQPKQEWSEEDEAIRQSIIKGIKWERDNTPVTVDKDIRKYNEQINWLKSLRPSWKPSEEQMRALEECGECKRCVKELYEQLKSIQ